jgi:hypothetical protein
VYQTPYCRIGAFAIGLLVGHEIRRLRNRLEVPSRLHLFGYFVSLTMLLAVIYIPYDSSWTAVEYAIYFALTRVAWACAIGLFIWLCAMKSNATLDTFLSTPAFVGLSNLTYCAYLIYPIVQYVYFFSFKSVIVGSHAILFMNFIGIALITYAFACMLFLTVEMPLLALKGVCLRSSRS